MTSRFHLFVTAGTIGLGSPSTKTGAGREICSDSIACVMLCVAPWILRNYLVFINPL